MLSSVLRTSRAVRVNIEIMRAFVRLRELSAKHRDLAERIDEIEGRFEGRFRIVFKAIRKLMPPPRHARGRGSDSIPRETREAAEQNGGPI